MHTKDNILYRSINLEMLVRSNLNNTATATIDSNYMHILISGFHRVIVVCVYTRDNAHLSLNTRA